MWPLTWTRLLQRTGRKSVADTTKFISSHTSSIAIPMRLRFTHLYLSPSSTSVEHSIWSSIFIYLWTKVRVSVRCTCFPLPSASPPCCTSKFVSRSTPVDMDISDPRAFEQILVSGRLDEYLGSLQSTKYLAVSCFCLLVYDYVLTLEYEVSEYELVSDVSDNA